MILFLFRLIARLPLLLLLTVVLLVASADELAVVQIVELCLGIGFLCS